MVLEKPLCACEWRNAKPCFSSFQEINLTSLRRQKLCAAFSSSLPLSLEGKKTQITSAPHSLLEWILLPDLQRFIIEMLTEPNL